MEAPVIFFCRNNGWAISTPVADQFRSISLSNSRSLSLVIFESDNKHFPWQVMVLLVEDRHMEFVVSVWMDMMQLLYTLLFMKHVKWP